MENKKIFNKLVRDKIPEIIERNGDIPEIEIIDDSQYLKMLDEKLMEECSEVIKANDKISKTEEIADTLEVLYAMIDFLGLTMEEVEIFRLNKQKEKGAFKSKILLKSTISKKS